MRVVGRQLRLNDEPYVVVGVAPDEFTFRDPNIRMWVPLAFTPEQRAEDRRFSQNHDSIARLKEGATVEQAQARLDALNVVVVERAGSAQERADQCGLSHAHCALRRRHGARRSGRARSCCGEACCSSC